MEWSTEKIEQLISYVQERPFLFDVSSCDYHNRLKRQAAMDDLAKLLETTSKCHK